MPFQELPAGKRFDAEHNMLFLLAALADIQHIIIILYITPFQIKAALPVQAAAAVAQNSNFFIGQPLGDQRQDFFLSVGELPIAAV